MMLSATLLLATACSSEEPAASTQGAETSVTFSVDMPKGIASRVKTAYADGTSATRLTYALYRFDKGTNDYVYVQTKSGIDVVNHAAQVNMNLLTGERYAVVFWAAAKNAPYTFDGEARSLTVDYDKLKTLSNDEYRDAFYCCDTIEVNANASYEETMRRPFAQLNIGTSDMEEVRRDANFTVTSTAVKVRAYDKFNLLSGECDGNYEERTFDFAQRPQGEFFPVEPTTYDYLAMNYLLVGNDQELSNVVLEVKSADGQEKSCEYGNIPLRRNYRTNIYGQLLTTTNEFDVDLEKSFIGDNNTEIVYISEGYAKASDREEYYVSSAEGLETLNEQLSSYKNGTVINITEDIDFEGRSWNKIGWNACDFTEFNGNGHTISNLTLNDQAMFSNFVGKPKTIKNISFENANVTSTALNTSLLCVQSYVDVTLEDVHVKNSTFSGAYKVAPLIGTMYDENANSTKVLTVKNCSVEDCEVITSRYDFMCAGMIAFVYEADGEKVTFENCLVKNVNLYGKGTYYNALAYVYCNDGSPEGSFDEVEGVTVENCTKTHF